MPGHNFIAAFIDPFQTRGSSVQSQTYGIQDGGFACPGGTGYGKYSIVAVGWFGKIYFPNARQRIEVLKAKFLYAQINVPPYSAIRSVKSISFITSSNSFNSMSLCSSAISQASRQR
jgi:hypothetical protein